MQHPNYLKWLLFGLSLIFSAMGISAMIIDFQWGDLIATIPCILGAFAFGSLLATQRQPPQPPDTGTKDDDG